MKRKYKRVLIDTRTYYYYTYDEYVDYCFINKIKQYDEDSDEFYWWQKEQVELDTENFFYELKHFEDDTPVIITGEIGRWDGSFDIDPIVIFADKNGSAIYNAIQKCVCNNSILEFEVILENGIIYVNAMHHDSTNHFEIFKLSKKGIKKANSANNNTEYKKYHFAKFPYDITNGNY